MEDEDHEPVYVPLKERRAAKLQAYTSLAVAGRESLKRPRGLVAESDGVSAAKQKRSLLDEKAEMLAKGNLVTLSKE